MAESSEPVGVDDLVWHSETLKKIRRHGGSVRICVEVKNGQPKFFPQSGRTGSHKMVGPDSSGRFWTIIIDYLGDGQAEPITAWPSTRKQIRQYEEAITWRP